MSPVASEADLQQRCIETIRFLAVDGVQKANSGHPGMPMGAAAVAYTLFTRHLRYDPADPAWPDRDRFVLSAGHASMLLYSMLHLTGYDVTMDDLKSFRQWGSRTPGHPEFGHTAGVETTTGPLGQGVANAVGMAVAERFLAATFGADVVDHYTYVLAGDGCMMEGISSEAASFAGHQKLGKLILIYDDNHITIDGPTDLAFSEDVCASASRPTAGTCSASPTATTWTPSTRPSPRPRPRPASRRSSPCARTSAAARRTSRTRRRRTALRSAPTRSS